MQSIRLLAAVSTAVLTGTLAAPCLAGPTPPPPAPQFESHFAFARGSMEAEWTLGGFGVVDTEATPEDPDMGYLLGSGKMGWMLNDPCGSGVFRGNFEFLIGAFGGYIFEGPGDYLVGGRLGMRYNFIQEGATAIPFLEIGGGGIYSDAASDDPVQRLIGADWSWELHASLGVRFMLNDRMSLNVAVEYQHISNGDSTEGRNHGANGLGGSVGVSLFF